MTRHTDSVEVMLTDQRSRHWSVAEKTALVPTTPHTKASSDD